MVLIRKDNPRKVTPNFSEAEIHSAAYGFGSASFFMDEKVLKGGQIIRSFFGVPSDVNSSRRTKEHELSRGRSGNSKHVDGLAIDYDYPDEIILQYHQEILKKGGLWHLLRNAGITGFGLYDGFIHIDTRTNGNTSDEYGSFTLWDSRITTKKKV